MDEHEKALVERRFAAECRYRALYLEGKRYPPGTLRAWHEVVEQAGREFDAACTALSEYRGQRRDRIQYR